MQPKQVQPKIQPKSDGNICRDNVANFVLGVSNLQGSLINIEVLTADINDDKKNKLFTLYECMVTFTNPNIHGGTTQMWTVFRRYSQFRDLYLKVKISRF